MADQAVADADRAIPAAEPASAYYVEKDGLTYAGTHLLIDLWGSRNLDDVEAITTALAASVEAAGATLLKIELHRFNSTGGVSGVAILAESHMSIHTWPETGYAAIDMFVCGTCDAYRAVAVLRDSFQPAEFQLTEHKRGLRP